MKKNSRKKQPKFNDHGLKNYQNPDRFGEWLGYHVTHLRRGVKAKAEVTLAIRKDHLSPAMRVHGGVASALFDIACGAAVFATMKPTDYCSTVELKVNYFRPIELGDLLTAKTEVMFRGKRLCGVRGLLFRNDEQDPVGMCAATFNVVSKA
jgi:acyl-CoA thioesterase